MENDNTTLPPATRTAPILLPALTIIHVNGVPCQLIAPALVTSTSLESLCREEKSLVFTGLTANERLSRSQGKFRASE